MTTSASSLPQTPASGLQWLRRQAAAPAPATPAAGPGVALWGTQAGGLASSTGDHKIFVWHELPEWATRLPVGHADRPNLGEPVSREIDMIPANDLARRVMRDSEVSW